MNAASALTLAAIALAAAGCSGYSQSDSSIWRDKPSYNAMGQPQPARAYHYGETTVVEFPPNGVPVLFRVDDANGRTAKVEQQGRFFRVQGRLESFTAWINGRAVPVTVRADRAAIEDKPSNAPPVAPAKVERVSVATRVEALRAELAEVRSAMASLSAKPSASEAEWAPLVKRLDVIESQIGSAAAALIAVSFNHGSTDFNPSPATRRLLRLAVRTSESVSVKGFTDSRMAGPADPGIALGRAENARKYLVQQGADPVTIAIASQSAGGFVAPNATFKGREKNRRVEIQFTRRVETLDIAAVKEKEPM